ncbi:ethanolamine ammonia-lyase reactivating factor EutA [Escherichia coli]|nr:ethanolamine ammonia-lyase reactivating factor EutA [Escherichia coli]
MQNELQTALFQAFDTLNLQRVKTFSVPPVTLCGPGSVSSCGQQAQTRGLKHLFVMADSFLHQAGMTAGLTRSLTVKGIAMTLWPCPVGEPCITDVCAAVAQLRESGCDGVIAFGGGSVLDAAKAVTLLVTNPDSTLAEMSETSVLQPRLPLIAIPTTAGTGSETTNVTVIIDAVSGRKQVLAHASLMPDVAILDAALTEGVPSHVTAMTGIDALTHAIEAYSALNATPFTDSLAIGAIAMIGKSLPKAVGYGHDLAARESMLLASCMAVMALSQSLGDFVVASAGPHLESVIAGHGAGAQTLSEQRLCRVLNIDIGGGTANYALFDAGKISGTACLNVGGRLLETDSHGRVVYAHKPGQMIVDECFGAGTDARSLTGAQLVQVTRRMAELIVEVIDGTLSPLAQALMQTGLLPAGVTPEIITLSGGVGECYRHQPAYPFCFADIGPLLATALHDHPRLREMNVQFPAQTVRATVIGAGAHTLSLSGSTIWLEGVQLPMRNLPVAIPIDETDLVGAWQQALIQLDLDPKTDAYVLALPASLPVRYAAVLTVINALVDFVARFPNPHPLLVVAGQDFGKALGMLLRPQLQQLPLAVIDEVIVRAGDYIDIGTPLFGGSVVPVTVKSLAFPS